MAMTLKARLARLEKIAAPILEAADLPPGMHGAVLLTIAMVCGGYPQSQNGAAPGETDSVGDAFARALGYPNRAAMERGGSDALSGRQAEVLSALWSQHGADLGAASAENALRMCVRAMTAAGHDVSSPSPLFNDFRAWASAAGAFLEVLRAQALRHPISAARPPEMPPLGAHNVILPGLRQNHV